MKQHRIDRSRALKRRRLCGLFAAIGLLAVVVVVTAPPWRAWFVTGPETGEVTVPPATAAEGTLPADMGPSWRAMDDPAKDGWDSEVFSARAGKVLKKLAALLVHPRPTEPNRFAPLLSKDFSCGTLLPRERRAAFQDNVFHVERAKTAAKGLGRTPEPRRYQGPAGLARAIQSLTVPLKDAQGVRCEFKLFRVMRSGDGVTTLQHVAVTGRVRQATIEQHATWRIRWQRGKESDATPRLARIEVADFEQTKIEHPQGKLFADCTESVLGGNDSYRKQFLRGMNHWFERIQDKRHFYLLGNPGLAVGDVNGDGLDDLYVCQEEGLPNRLFLQRKDGSARDVSAEWGVDWLHSSRGVLLVDLDNDGDQDLAVAMVGSLILAANDGRRFTIRAVLATDEDSMSLSSADYDGDGDLDLFVCAYFESGKNKSTIRGEILGGVAGDGIALGGGRNTLFRNDIARGGDWRFTDVTKASGVDVKNKRYSFASSWEDYDQDGDPDLYVVNDYGRNNLFRNDGGRFTDVTATAAAEDDAFGMAVTWGDYDRDGWMDLHVSNMFSSAGGRVTHSDRFRNVGAAWRNKLQRSARGNTLLRNTGTGRFTDVTDRAGIAMGRWAWSSNFVDVNNDGWDDILVANGFLTTDDTGDL